jgi:transcription termination factor NusB
MDIHPVKNILTQKEPAELYDLVQPAQENSEIRDLLVEGCFAKDEVYRYNCVRVCFRTLEEQPSLFYPYWERFAEMLDSPNGFYRSTAAQALALLAAVDENQQLNSILDSYLQVLDDEKIMVARYFTQAIHLVAKARPDLREKIITHLLKVENTRHTESRKSLLKADIISAFDRLFDMLSAQEQKKILAFVEKEQDSESPTTRKAVSAFLEKYQR